MAVQSSSQNQKVLVVDDEEELRALLCYELKRGGFEPIPCLGYNNALENYLEHLPSLILSDMRMPDGTGLALFLKIKELQASIPNPFSFFVITGYCKESPDALKAQGIEEVLFKPFVPAAVVSLLKNAKPT
jgi:DNA-binding NtrC family response regulator